MVQKEIELKKVKLHLGYSGYCLAKENHTLKNGKNIEIKFFALWGLIKHPSNGIILFDTGYTHRFFEATKKYPNKFYAKLTKVVLKKEEEVRCLLETNNINADEIKHVIVSHFHADHVGGLKDFKNAKIHVSQKAFKQATTISKTFGFSKGVLKDLIPDDLHLKASIIEDNSVKINDPFFKHKYDLFGDQSILVFNLDGHAAGQIGILIQTDKEKYFLIADSCWNIKAITEGILPNPIVRLFFDSWSDYKSTIYKIQKFHENNKEVKIIPTHCSTTTDVLVSNKISFNDL